LSFVAEELQYANDQAISAQAHAEQMRMKRHTTSSERPLPQTRPLPISGPVLLLLLLLDLRPFSVQPVLLLLPGDDIEEGFFEGSEASP
jgi:hypothetical protein